MKPRYRLLGAVMLQASLLFSFAAATSAPGRADDALLQTATEAYLWGYPLVYNMDTFDHFLAGESPRFGDVRFNRFSHARALQGPEDQFVSPNVDVLFSLAICNLADGPLVLGVPDTLERYYVLQFLDPWTNNFAYIGRRATGTKPGIYLITDTNYDGPVPEGMTLIQTPAQVFAIVGRVAIDNEHELEAVHAVQDGFSLRLLNAAIDSTLNELAIPQPAPDTRTDLRFWERLRSVARRLSTSADRGNMGGATHRAGLAEQSLPLYRPRPGTDGYPARRRKSGER